MDTVRIYGKEVNLIFSDIEKTNEITSIDEIKQLVTNTLNKRNYDFIDIQTQIYKKHYVEINLISNGKKFVVKVLYKIKENKELLSKYYYIVNFTRKNPTKENFNNETTQKYRTQFISVKEFFDLGGYLEVIGIYSEEEILKELSEKKKEETDVCKDTEITQ